jgi:hypothetical protein
MQKATLLLIILLLLSTNGFAQTTKAIFRSIDVSTVEKKRSIELGGDLSRNADILIKTGDAFVLNGNFGNTERIAVFVSTSGRVREIVFDYGARREFSKLVETYVKDFGKPPIQQSLSSAVLNVRLVAWDDDKTRFEIVEVTQNGKSRISSALVDR